MPAKKKVEAVEAPAGEPRAFRKTRQGVVFSNKMEKTVVVKIERRVQHPLYGKVVLRTKKFKAHDTLGCDVGDRVEIMETRPISKEVRWRVSQILEKVK
jgi:small subunit ribosomal protein S17